MATAANCIRVLITAGVLSDAVRGVNKLLTILS